MRAKIPEMNGIKQMNDTDNKPNNIKGDGTNEKIFILFFSFGQK